MRKAGQDCPEHPCIPPTGIISLRHRLIKEELIEYTNAAATGDIVEVADAIADMLVVVLGTAVAHGIDIQPIFDEVMDSNMTKFIDGHKDSGGKWIKGPSYTPANIKPLIEAQM